MVIPETLGHTLGIGPGTQERGVGMVALIVFLGAGLTAAFLVEQVGGAVKCAKRNARTNGLESRCRYLRADATEYLTAAAKGGKERFDVVLMDPPRAGSTPEFLSAVAALGPQRLVYVSCNAETQARDLAFIRQRGYRLEKVSPVDMFPHTKHVELVAVLSK